MAPPYQISYWYGDRPIGHAASGATGRSIDGMMKRAVGVLTSSEVGDLRVGQRDEPADIGMVERSPP